MADGKAGGHDRGRGARTHDRTGHSFDLHTVVVSYEGRPDRCTIYPRRRSCRDRTSTWLSAVLDAFYDLEDVR